MKFSTLLLDAFETTQSTFLNEGSLTGLNGKVVKVFILAHSAAAPATVGDEFSVFCTTGLYLGRSQRVLIRKPGDLPSVVVTRLRVGRGVPING